MKRITLKKLAIGMTTSILCAGLLVSCNESSKTSSTTGANQNEVLEVSGPYIFKNAPANGAVAKILGEEVSDAEFRKGMENELFDAEEKLYELKMGRLKEIILEKLIDKDPRKKDMSADEFLEKFVSTSKEPTSEEIDKFIEEKKIPKEYVNDQLKQRVKDYIVGVEKQKAVETWLEDQLGKNPVEVYLNRPKRPVFDVVVGQSPSMGSENAKVTLVEFADFECPYCDKAAKILHKVKDKYGDKVRVVFKNFPLSFHKQAQKASEAALCAEKQKKGMFWEMHDLLFKNQDKLAENHLKEFAKDLKLDSAGFEKCLNDGEFKKAIDSDIDQGEKIGVRSTPTFFINGQMVSGVRPFEAFTEIIDQELAK